MKNTLALFLFLVALSASAGDSTFTVGHKPSMNMTAAEVFTSGLCTVTILESGDKIIVARKDGITHVVIVLGGQVREFWVDRTGSIPVISLNLKLDLIGKCSFPPDKYEEPKPTEFLLLTRK